MKKMILLIVLILCFVPCLSQSGNTALPLPKRIMAEKQLLAENYEKALQMCRKRPKKSSRHTCIEQKKESFGNTFEALDRDPITYFANQDRNTQNGKNVQEARKLILPK